MGRLSNEVIRRVQVDVLLLGNTQLPNEWRQLDEALARIDLICQGVWVYWRRDELDYMVEEQIITFSVDGRGSGREARQLAGPKNALSCGTSRHEHELKLDSISKFKTSTTDHRCRRRTAQLVPNFERLTPLVEGGGKTVQEYTTLFLGSTYSWI